MSRLKLSPGAFFASGTGRVILHVVFWILYMNSPIFMMEVNTFSSNGILLFEVMNLLFIPYYYLLANVLIPKLFTLKRSPLFVVSWVGSYVLMAYCVQQVSIHFLYTLTTEAEIATFKKVAETSPTYFPEFFRMIFVTMVPLSIMLVRRYARISTQQTELKRMNADLELNFLKSQMNPHFLFNSLNNIYALALQQSEKTPGLILQLSDLMRYMLYECNAAQVALDKELNFLRDYIGLEKVRHGEKVKIEFNIKGETSQKQIAPLLLLPFVENAFKHGVNAQLGPAWVSVDFNAEDPEGGCTFVVRNNKPVKTEKTSSRAGGIGLENARKRLDLLYPNKYLLHVDNHNEVYQVELKIMDL